MFPVWSTWWSHAATRVSRWQLRIDSRLMWTERPSQVSWMRPSSNVPWGGWGGVTDQCGCTGFVMVFGVFACTCWIQKNKPSCTRVAFSQLWSHWLAVLECHLQFQAERPWTLQQHIGEKFKTWETMNVYGHETWGKMMGRNPRNPRHHQSLHGFNSTSESISYQLAVSISCTSFQVMGDGHIELTRELREPASPALSHPEQQRCCGRRVLLFFVILHSCTLLSEILAILNFLIFANYSMMCAMTVPLLLSGMVCGHVAWRAELTHLDCSFLPLKTQTWYWKALLWMPLGLFQGVIVLLAWDDYLEQSTYDESEFFEAPPAPAPADTGEGLRRRDSNRSEAGNDWNRFHCKARCYNCYRCYLISIDFHDYSKCFKILNLTRILWSKNCMRFKT